MVLQHAQQPRAPWGVWGPRRRPGARPHPLVAGPSGGAAPANREPRWLCVAAAGLCLAACGDSVREAATPPVAPVTIAPTRAPGGGSGGGSAQAWLAAETPSTDARGAGGDHQDARAAALALVAAGDRARASGEDEAALSSYQAAVARGPSEPHARFALAAALAEAGRLDEAIQQLEKLRTLSAAAAAGELRAARVEARFDALRASAKLGERYRAVTGYYPVAVAGTRGLTRRVAAVLADPTGTMAARLVARNIPATVRGTPWRSGARVATVVYAKGVPAAKAMAEEVSDAMVFPPRMVASKRFDGGDPVVVVVPPSAARALATAKGAGVGELLDRPLAARGADGAEHTLRLDRTGAFHWQTREPGGERRDRRGRYLFTGARLHLTYREEVLPAEPGAAGSLDGGQPAPAPAGQPISGGTPDIQQGRRHSYDVSRTPDALYVGELCFRPALSQMQPPG